jgi:hypothetical protein
VNDNGKVTLDALQIMHNILCYPNHLFSFNQKTKLKKSLISYYKTSGITYLRKHIDANHSKKSRRSELCNGRKFEKASCKKYQI